MSTDATNPPDPPPRRKARFLSFPDWDTWNSVFWRCVFAFICGAMLNGFFVGMHSIQGTIRMFSNPSFAGKPTARGLLHKKDGQDDPAAGTSPAEKRQFIKAEFARHLQGMTWSWTGELQAAAP